MVPVALRNLTDRLAMPDDPWDDWEVAADAGLEPPPVKATTTKTKKQSAADLQDEHDRNKQIWSEANTFQAPQVVRTDTIRTEYIPEVQILKRPKNPGSTTYTPQTSQPQRAKTLAEREAAYAKAREKIFGASSPAETSTATAAEDIRRQGGAPAEKVIHFRPKSAQMAAPSVDPAAASVVRQPRPPDADGERGGFRGGYGNGRGRGRGQGRGGD